MIMGCFHLFKHGSMKTTIRRDRNTIRSDIDFFSFTIPTEAEIKDRGKSDWLAKSLVLLQTSWFVMQCIARAIKHLPVTHLEIVTLAYAAMNLVIYVFWWNKPLNVNRPVRVFRKSDVKEPISETQTLASEANRTGLNTILRFIAGNRDNFVNLNRADRVPRFWANSTLNDAMIADIIMLEVGICFGAIHCIAWGFSFPTRAQLLMWRVSCVAITAVLFYIFLMFSLGVWLHNLGFKLLVYFIL